MMRIDVHYAPKRSQFVGLALELGDQLRARGFDLRNRGDSEPQPGADGYLLQHRFVRREVLDWGLPVIMAERRDASIVHHREHVEHPSVVAVWKLALAPPEHQQRTVERWHSRLMGVPQPKPRRPLSQTAIAKLDVAPHYGVYQRMRSWHGLHAADERRTIAAGFRGKLNYPRAPEIGQHRGGCIAAMRRIHGSLALARRLPAQAYQRELTRTRVAVSPWGYGELCWRDCEAMYAGCVVVKPNSDYVQTWPRLFEADQTYAACRPDWSDLRQVCQRVIDQWGDWCERRAANAERLREACEPETLADYFACLLQRFHSPSSSATSASSSSSPSSR